MSSLIRLQHPKGCGKAASSPFTDETFTAFLFVLFNLLDLVGRTSAGFVRLISPAWLPVAAALRCVFVPLFLLCNIRGSEFEPVVFRNEAWPCLFMVSQSGRQLVGYLLLFERSMALPLRGQSGGPLKKHTKRQTDR